MDVLQDFGFNAVDWYRQPGTYPEKPRILLRRSHSFVICLKGISTETTLPFLINLLLQQKTILGKDEYDHRRSRLRYGRAMMR
jgi:hypothetical protein